MLIEIIDLGCKQKLFVKQTLNEYLKKYLKEKSKEKSKDVDIKKKLNAINKWFNSLIFHTIYRALEESLKDKASEKSVLKININQALCTMTSNCIFGNGFLQYVETEYEIIRNWVQEKLDSDARRNTNFVANSCFWYIKMKFQESEKEKSDYARRVKFNQASRDLQFFIFAWKNINCKSVNELLKKDSSFSFLFQKEQVDEKGQTWQEVPKQEPKDKKQKSNCQIF